MWGSKRWTRSRFPTYLKIRQSALGLAIFTEPNLKLSSVKQKFKSGMPTSSAMRRIWVVARLATLRKLFPHLHLHNKLTIISTQTKYQIKTWVASQESP